MCLEKWLVAMVIPFYLIVWRSHANSLRKDWINTRLVKKKVMDIEPARQLHLNFKNLNSKPSYNSTIALNLRVSHPLVFDRKLLLFNKKVTSNLLSLNHQRRHQTCSVGIIFNFLILRVKWIYMDWAFLSLAACNYDFHVPFSHFKIPTYFLYAWHL
jgi:hypothetical protein